jgi:sugar phosphate isomerase/epimerase
MKLGFHVASLPGLALGESLDLVAKAGFCLAELEADRLFRTIEQDGYQQTLAVIKSSPLKILSLGRLTEITFNDMPEHEEVVDTCHRLAEIAAEIGCPFLVATPGNLPAGVTEKEVRKETTGVLRELAQICLAYDVGLGLEFQGRPDCSVPTFWEALQIIYRTDRVNVGVVVDAFQFVRGDSQLENIERLDPRSLFILRANDSLETGEPPVWRRVLPGEGTGPVSEIIGGVQRNGYTKTICLEPSPVFYGNMEPAELLSKSLTALQDLLGSLS